MDVYMYLDGFICICIYMYFCLYLCHIHYFFSHEFHAAMHKDVQTFCGGHLVSAHIPLARPHYTLIYATQRWNHHVYI